MAPQNNNRAIAIVPETELGVGMQVRIKLIERDAKIPERAHDGDAGADLFAVHGAVINPGRVEKIDIGIAVGVPFGFEGQIRPRSGLLTKGIIGQLGTLDFGYTGSLAVILHNTTREAYTVRTGDRVGQLVVSAVELPEFEPCAELAKSDRGANGLGSTGVSSRRQGNSG
jgi:dUTP pyrophosphatase